ncbi:glycerophosphodiester phosphodiesterase family protein [Phytomonospora sp. NPDC050363]|uniref:glycerophosphodiester phosphodiesterase family protein n=1 Tax=Phytomonospora sp. NPDC050363 TaxID=3155642 RepID=UPI0033FE0E89
MPQPAATAGHRPRWRKRRYRVPALIVVVLAAFMFANNTNLFAGEPTEDPGVLAHRGMAQTFDESAVGPQDCTAQLIDPPVHGYLENTVAGIRAAFDAGADQVEFDVHWTADGQFAVFHDWELDCRTDGTGTTRDHTMDELRLLDVGHGYTADGGATFPFRGKGIGLMPTLTEVLDTFPGRSLLVNIKSDDAAEGQALAAHLATLAADRRAELAVYGGDAPIAAIRGLLPDLRVMSKETITDCLLAYEAMSWTGVVPDTCANTQLHIPEGHAPWLWGWTERFAERMGSVGTTIALVAGSGGFSEGFDTAADLDRVPEGFTGLVWTNRVDTVAPLVDAG